MAGDLKAALGQLICNLNPYTSLPKPGMPHETVSSTARTGEMDPFFGADADPNKVDLEVETNYPGEWIFKGHPQRVVKAVRIKYRYPVRDNDGNNLYYVTDYLLVGYEGGSA